MKILNKKLWGWVLALASLVFPALALAQNSVQSGLTGIGGLFPHSGISGATSVTGLIGQVISILLLLSGAVAVLFVIIGGFWYITSAGNAEQAEKGQKTLINAIIGIIVVILSWVIINVIVNLVSGGGGFFGGLFG